MVKEIALMAYLLGGHYVADFPNFKIISSVFSDQHAIPRQYTCQGKNLTLPIDWKGLPPDTRSLTLIMKDVDSPYGIWYHWILYNIPTRYEENKNNRQLISMGKAGKNSWGRMRYDGPCPPSGVHRYFISLYALDDKLSLNKGATPSQLIRAMKGHIIAVTNIMGTVSANTRST